MIMDGEDGELPGKTSEVVLGKDQVSSDLVSHVIRSKLLTFVKIKGGNVTFGGGDEQSPFSDKELLFSPRSSSTDSCQKAGKVPNVSHLKPFGCHVTILNTSDHLGKFEGKADEGFLVGYSAHSKAYRVYNLSNKKIEETLNLRYMEDKPNVQGLDHEWTKHLTTSYSSKGCWCLCSCLLQSSSVVEPVHADTPLPPGHSLGSSENSIRFSSPSDLANHISSSSEMEGIHHLPTTGIFSESTYDADFGGSATNLAPTIAVDPVSTRRILDRLCKRRMKQFVNQDVWKLCAFARRGKTAFWEKWLLRIKRVAKRVYVTQPKGFEDPFTLNMCTELLKSFVWSSSSTTKGLDLMIGFTYVFDSLKAQILCLLVSACLDTKVILLTSNLNAAYSDSDYAGSNGDRKSTTGGCQFLGRRLISWQCQKANCSGNFFTEQEFVPPTNLSFCCSLLWSVITHIPIQATIESIADLKYRDEHNKVGFLEKPKGSAVLSSSSWFFLGVLIRYAINHDTIIYGLCGSKNFGNGLSLGTFEEGPPAIIATIDSTPYTITESLVRSQLQLDDEGGVEDLPSVDIYLGMDNMGYPTEGKLTFHKNKFSPQWRFIVHTIMHCLSTKTGSWDQFGSSLATALICLTEGRKFNWETLCHLATMLPPAQPAIAGDSSGEAEPTIPHTVPEILTEPAHSHDQASSPPGPTTIPASAQENEQGPFSDPNPASSSMNSLVQKIDSQASDLKAHKLVFKEVVRKLVKKVKELEEKLKGRKRKFVMTESNIEEEEEQDVDPLIKLAKAVPTGGSNEDDIPPSSSIPSDGSAIPPDVTTGPTDAPFDKGKSHMLEEEPPSCVTRSFRQREEEDMLGVHAIQGLSADLLGPDVNEDNFAARMVALVAERRRKFAAQRHALDNLQSQHLRRSLKRQGADLEPPDSKKSKSTEPQKTSVPAASRPSSAGVTPDVHQSPFVDTPPATPSHSPKTSSHPDVPPDTSKQPSVAPTPPSGFSATPTVTRTSVDLIAADSQEDVEVPSTTTSTAQQKASSTKKVGTRRKQFGRKGVHPSRSTIPIEDGDPDADHKLCINGKNGFSLLGFYTLSEVPMDWTAQDVNGYLVNGFHQIHFSFYDSILRGCSLSHPMGCDENRMYVVPTGRVIATISIKFLLAGAIYLHRLKDLSRAEAYKVPRQVTSSANPVDALNTIQKGDELGSNGGSANSGEIVVQDVAGLASGSPSNIPLWLKGLMSGKVSS
ncbi:putative ribonuclease H-like domain-containing protein [Tanacetum coccineum]|uniref:Ribonuclease H-like domain-containing protein n=1 Tax=Tanacetum coccineum TaxID=301880 RepID=A0ABQ5EQW9_9ASTR